MSLMFFKNYCQALCPLIPCPVSKTSLRKYKKSLTLQGQEASGNQLGLGGKNGIPKVAIKSQNNPPTIIFRLLFLCLIDPIVMSLCFMFFLFLVSVMCNEKLWNFFRTWIR